MVVVRKVVAAGAVVDTKGVILACGVRGVCEAACGCAVDGLRADLPRAA